MADFNQQQENFNFYQGNYGQQQQQQPPNQGGYYNPQDYPMETESGGISIGDPSEFPQDTQFQQFDYSQSQTYPGGADPQFMTSTPYPGGGTPYSGSIMTPDPVQPYNPDPGVEDYDNEPPLLEELGINFDHIKQKTVAVLNPLIEPDHTIMLDTDLAGPLVFCFIFGGCLLMTGKVQFGYIYGIAVVGCMAMYALLNLMSMTGVTVSIIVSVLGYCLLPMCVLSSVGIVLSLQGLVGIVLTAAAVLWCSISASKLFVNALSMDHQQLLVAYPCALVYGVFALIAVF